MKKTFEVVAAVIMKDDKVFCVQRGPKRALAFKWEFPGGKIEYNENHCDALIREIREELDSTIDVKEKITCTEYEYDDFRIRLHSYYCTLIEGKLTLTEHIRKAWVNPEDLPKLDFAEADKETVTLLIKQSKT